MLPLLVLPCLGAAGEAEKKPWPLWDGKETVGDYARRTGLKAEETLDLGGGVTMKFVLIPAGEFVMGSRSRRSPGARRRGTGSWARGFSVWPSWRSRYKPI